jgi:non-ribosomal peptide synthetase component F
VSKVCFEAYAHQDLPFERLVQELQTERSLRHSPVFNVMLNMVNFPARAIRLSEVRVELPFCASPWAKFDLTLYVCEEPQGPNLVLVYNADLFEPERMSEMLEQLKHLIGQIVEAPDKTIGSYSLVTPRTRTCYRIRQRCWTSLDTIWSPPYLLRGQPGNLTISRFDRENVVGPTPNYWRLLVRCQGRFWRNRSAREAWSP